MAMLGLIGGPLIILAGIGVIFDLVEGGGPVQGLMTIPEALWELSVDRHLPHPEGLPAFFSGSRRAADGGILPGPMTDHREVGES